MLDVPEACIYRDPIGDHDTDSIGIDLATVIRTRKTGLQICNRVNSDSDRGKHTSYLEYFENRDASAPPHESLRGAGAKSARPAVFGWNSV